MANFNANKKPKLKTYNKFLGINQSLGETSLKDGEAVLQENWRITDNFELEKREGYTLFYDFSNTRPVINIWMGTVKESSTWYEVAFIATKSTVDNTIYLYRYNFSTSTMDSLDSTTRSNYSGFIEFDNSVYFRTDTVFLEKMPAVGTTVAPPTYYTPRAYIECTPTLSTFTALDELNIMNKNWYQESRGDNSSTVFQLAVPRTGTYTLPNVWKNGVLLTLTTDYSFNPTTKQVTFVATPALDALLKFEVSATQDPSTIMPYLCFTNAYAKNDDIRYFVYGNDKATGDANSYKNLIRWSDSRNLLYFPETSFVIIGGGNDVITALVNQYDKQIIFTKDSAYFMDSLYSSITSKIEFPVSPMNEFVGNESSGQVKVIKNSPITLFKNSLRMWEQSNIINQLNESEISSRISQSLLEEDMSLAITFDNKSKSELFIVISDMIYVWNYKINVFYIYTGIDARCLFDYNGSIYFGSTGKIMKIGGTDDYLTAINATAELSFTDFESPTLYKNSRKIFVTIKPYSRSSLEIEFDTDRKSGTISENNPIEYVLFDYESISYDDWTYDTNTNLQKFKRKYRARKYAFIKLRLINNRLDESVVVLEINIEAETSGEVK